MTAESPSPGTCRGPGAIERDPVILGRQAPQPCQPAVVRKSLGGPDFYDRPIALSAQRGGQEIEQQLALAIRHFSDGHPGAICIPGWKIGPARTLLGVEVQYQPRPESLVKAGRNSSAACSEAAALASPKSGLYSGIGTSSECLRADASCELDCTAAPRSRTIATAAVDVVFIRNSPFERVAGISIRNAGTVRTAQSSPSLGDTALPGSRSVFQTKQGRDS